MDILVIFHQQTLKWHWHSTGSFYVIFDVGILGRLQHFGDVEADLSEITDQTWGWTPWNASCKAKTAWPIKQYFRSRIAMNWFELLNIVVILSNSWVLYFYFFGSMFLVSFLLFKTNCWWIVASYKKLRLWAPTRTRKKWPKLMVSQSNRPKMHGGRTSYSMQILQYTPCWQVSIVQNPKCRPFILVRLRFPMDCDRFHNG